MNIWLESLYMEQIKNNENKQEDISLSKMKEELQDISAKGRRLNIEKKVNIINKLKK